MEYLILTIFAMLILFVVIVGSIFVYFVPTFVAWYIKSPNTLWIFLINLFLGFTTVGWFAAFLWALYDAGAFDTFKPNKT